MGGIAGNRYYNDPVLGQAFSNLTAAFAPPSAGDLNAYASAKAKREEAARLAQLFDVAQQNGFDQTTFDRMGQAAGQWTPNTGYFGVNSQAETSRANNAADNARALEVQRAQEAAAMERLGVTDATARRGQDINSADTHYKTQADFLGQRFNSPISQGGIVPGVPADVMRALGLPEIDPQVMGPQIGRNKPMSETEVKGADLADLINRGLISDHDRVNDYLGSQTPVQALGPDGKPRYMAPGEAVREGAQPFVKPDASTKPTNALAVLSDGTRVPAVQSPTGQWMNAQTGQMLPPDIQVFDMPRPQGSASDVGLAKPTEASDRAGIFYNRAAPASANIDAALGNGYVPSDMDYEFSLGAGSGAPNAIANRAVSDEGRKFYNNAQNFMMAVLRPDTGAAFGKEEFQSYARVFIPLPGDDPATIRDKSLARQTALAALQGTSRGSAEEIARILQTNGLPVPPEMAAVIARGGVRGAPASVPAASGASASPPTDGIPTVSTPEEAMQLPSGTQFRTPDGRLKTRP